MCRRCIRRKPEHTALSDGWTWQKLLKIAPAAQEGGACRSRSASARPRDSVDFVGALFRAFGAELVDAKGNITVNSDPVRAGAGVHGQKLAKFLPPDAYSYDDASNNRALISGKSALIFNPPSAWAVAKRDNPPVGGGLLDLPRTRRAEGTLRAVSAVLLGHLVVQQEQDARRRS